MSGLELPAPRILDPAAVPVLRWGVVGTGIADRLVGAMHRYTSQRAVAVTARDSAKTAAFAERHGIPVIAPDLDALLADPGIDAVYISTPHVLHREQALAALAAGKHVLIEKPIAMSAAEALDITSAAAERGLLAMEAMWARYLPQADIVRQVLERGQLGEVRLVTADFGFAAPMMPEHRLWNPSLGGGALLDAGVYPISFASSVLGAPTSIRAVGELAETGVDARADVLLTSATGATAFASTSLVTATPAQATIMGSEGFLELGRPFFAPSGVTLTKGGFGEPEIAAWRDDSGFIEPHDGLSCQVTAFAAYVGEGRTESPVHPHAETVSVMATIDEARRQLGVV